MELSRKEENIGNPDGAEATFRSGSAGLRSFAAILILCLSVLFLILIVYGLQRGYYGFTRYGLVAAAAWGTPWLTAGLISAVPILAWLFFRRRNTKGTVSVYARGLHIALHDREDVFLSWHQIDGIRYGGVQTFLLFLPTSTRHQLSIASRGGPPIDLDSGFEHLDQLAEEIKKRYYPVKLSEYQRRIKSGEAINFGLVRLEPWGAILKNEQFQWTEITDYSVRRGYLLIHARPQKTIKIPVFEIPDLELLLTLFVENAQ